jgi:hypothetical protein
MDTDLLFRTRPPSTRARCRFIIQPFHSHRTTPSCTRHTLLKKHAPCMFSMVSPPIGPLALPLWLEATAAFWRQHIHTMDLCSRSALRTVSLQYERPRRAPCWRRSSTQPHSKCYLWPSFLATNIFLLQLTKGQYHSGAYSRLLLCAHTKGMNLPLHAWLWLRRILFKWLQDPWMPPFGCGTLRPATASVSFHAMAAQFVPSRTLPTAPASFRALKMGSSGYGILLLRPHNATKSEG